MVLGDPMKLHENIHFTTIECKTQWNRQELKRQRLKAKPFMSLGHEVIEILLSSFGHMCAWPVGLSSCPWVAEGH